MRLFIFFMLAATFLSCKPGKKAYKIRGRMKPVARTVKYVSPADKGKLRNIEDSLLLKRMLTDIFSLATKHKADKHYRKNLHNWMSDGDTASMSYGYIFSRSQKHLIVTRTLKASRTYVNVYLLKDSVFFPVVQWFIDDNAFMDYSIKDVNGDHFKDFLVHLYSSSGFCRRNVYDVYLCRRSDGSFTKKYRFMNPTFSSREKVIRGVGYGQPGEVELYKYRWNGLNVDTVEIIFPDTIKKRYHIVKTWNDIQSTKVGRFITSIPREYHYIDSYRWFNDTE